MKKLAVGDRAPDFNLEDQRGNVVRLADFAGKKLIVYFYPRADTPGCTRQSCSVRDARESLASIGVAAVGISPDSPARLRKFDEKHGLGFPLLSDADHAVAEAYGAWGEKVLYGKKVHGIVRSSFLVDEAGRIAQAAYKVSPEDTVPLARAAID
jgi:peroxiredoxin Q/BCP